MAVPAPRSGLPTRRFSSPSSSSSGDYSVGPINGVAETEEGKVFVAVGKDPKEAAGILLWALQNRGSLGARRFVVVHVHRPAKMIPMMGGKFPASQLAAHHVKRYRIHEREMMDMAVDEYLQTCTSTGVEANKLVIESDDVAKALTELIAQNGITKLVMETGTDKTYSKKSKIACAVKKDAIPSCNIWFVCKGSLIRTRPASSVASPSSRWIQIEKPYPKSLFQGRLFRTADMFKHKSTFYDAILNGGRSIGLLHQGRSSETPYFLGQPNTEKTHNAVETFFGHPFDRISTSFKEQDHSSPHEVDAEHLEDSNSVLSDDESVYGSTRSCSVHSYEDDAEFLYTNSFLENREDVPSTSEQQDSENKYAKERKQLIDIVNVHEHEKLKSEEQAKDSVLKYASEKKEFEDALEREKLKRDELKIVRDKAIEELKVANMRNFEFDAQLSQLHQALKSRKDRLLEAESSLSSLLLEKDRLQKERDDAFRKAEILLHEKQQARDSTFRASNLSEFSLEELNKATCQFDSSRKIGGGGCGSTYKAFLRHTTVAIKKLLPTSLQSPSEFYQKMVLLSRVRHPNLLTLMGACSESNALIYEFLPNGSLEDHLCGTCFFPPLSWQVRVRIITEICSTLMFLHSNNPCIVHGNLKPSNVLLDTNLVSKLSDFGTPPRATNATTIKNRGDHSGSSAYLDPEFWSRGELTTASDIYSFGIIILQLLTGRLPSRISDVVQDALKNNTLRSILDPKAGFWPSLKAAKLAKLGLWCCETESKRRPDVVSDIWNVLAPIKESSLDPLPLGSREGCVDHVPSDFICPISQDVMRDPHIAADGFTYEGESIRRWLNSGHNTSPMTNLKLPSNQLIPNRALQSIILEWQQQHQC